MRERLFTMRMSTEESERLDRLAEHFGLNGAGVIRMLLKREDDSVRAVQPVPQVQPPKARKRAKR
ncbi:MAG: hypothetical protein JW940_12695 [Polyangiaceae bacterium]|nr:hypothetical protein [Polyangiaceae bacterium]